MSLAENQISNHSDFRIFIPGFFDDYPLESSEFRLYAHIQRRAGVSGCFESIPKMAQHCYMALKTAKNAIKLLLAAGMIEIQERIGTTNIYTLTPPSNWVSPDQVQLLRSQIKPTKETPVKTNPSQNCMGGGSKFAPSGGVNFARGVGSILTHKGIPIKVIPSKELTLSADSPAQEPCVCEETELDLQLNQEKEPIPDSSFSLPNKSESSHHTDIPSNRPTMAAGSFEKNEQSNDNPYKSARNVEELIEAWITDPTTFASDCIPVVVREKIKWNRWVLPWHSGGRKLHPQYQNFNPIVVDLVAVELASTASCTKDDKITHAVSVMNTWEKTKGGWTNLMQRYQQALKNERSRFQPSSPNPRTAPKPHISLAQAIAQDEQRRQQELALQTASALPQHSAETLLIKEKLFQRANSQKTRTSSTLSAAALLEVEAQLKQALGA